MKSVVGVFRNARRGDRRPNGRGERFVVEFCSLGRGTSLAARTRGIQIEKLAKEESTHQ